MKCALCGMDNPAGMRFCGGCAAPLTDFGLPATPDGPHGDRALGAPNPAGELKPVTVLFADVSGFTSLSETLDLGSLRNLVAACFDHLVPCIEHYGGTVNKFVGDEIMALFGAPIAHENDPERALRAALEMRHALAEFNEEQHVPLAVHFGVNTGLVYAGDVGGGGRRDYSVMGDAVNIASRIRAAAKPGEIIVGANTHRQAGHLFNWQSAGAMRVKGKAEEVTTYRLLEARAMQAGPSGRQLQATRGIRSPLVGREEEFATLRAALDRLIRGAGGIVSVIGEAGLGKSRLVAEARQEARKLGVSWLEGRTLSYGRTISYWPFLEILEQDAGIESDDTEAERFAKLARRIESIFGDQYLEILPSLATLLSLTLPEELRERVKYLDGEAMGHQLFRSMLLLVSRIARRSPVIVVLEDAHWLDASSVGLVEHVLSAAEEAPVLFVLVGRPEVDSPTQTLRDLVRREHGERSSEIVLRALSTAESVELVCNLIYFEELPPWFRDIVLQWTEGNPFFVEEVIRSMIDLGGLAQDLRTGRWHVTERAARITIPGTIQGVILARIDRLDEDLKRLLCLASVIGRSFFYRVLDSVAEAEERLDDDLAALESAELVQERAREPELEYTFKHALVREATYESILPQRRKKIHRKVAATIEALFEDRLDEFYGLLAHHYSKAEDWEKAQEYLFKAGDQAGSIAADAEALAHYEQAMEAYTRVFGDQWDPFQRAQLERKMGDALFRLGEHVRAREYLYRAVATLGNPFPTSPARVRRAIASQLTRQLGHRLLWWVPRAPVSTETVRRAQERILPYWSLCWMDVTESPVRLVLDTFLVVNLVENTGIGWAAAMGYAEIGMICDLVPFPRLSRYYHRRSLLVDERVQEQDSWGAQYSAAGVPFVLGIHEYMVVGNWARASDYLRRGRSAFFTLGRIRDWGAASHVLTHVLADQGNLTEALALGREVMTHGQETGDRVTEAWGRIDTGEVLFAQGKFVEAEANLLPAVAELLAALDFSNAVKVRARLAHCRLKQGKLDEARAMLAEELLQVRDHHVRGFFARNVWTGHAVASLAAVEEDRDPARSSALYEAKASCRMLRKHGKLDIGARVPGYRMQGTYEWLCGRPDKAERWWQKSVDLAERLGARHEGALTQLEIGRRLGDQAALQRAEAEFAEMGAAFDMTEARRHSGVLERPLGPRHHSIERLGDVNPVDPA